MKLRKIIGLFIALSILTLSLASCQKSCPKTPEDLMEKANKKLTRLDHTVEVDIDYTVRDSDISPLFEELENAEIKLYFDGDSVRVDNNSTISYGDGYADFYSSYTLIDGMVYASSGYTITEGSSLNKLKAEITDEEKETFVNRAGLIIGIGIEDFSTVTLDKRDGEYYITCTDSSVDTNIMLENLMVSQLQNAATSIGVKNACMVIELDDGKIDTVTLGCEYSFTLYGFNYSINAEFELEYDYDDRINVTTPSDADEYPYSEFDKILNTL